MKIASCFISQCCPWNNDENSTTYESTHPIWRTFNLAHAWRKQNHCSSERQSKNTTQETMESGNLNIYSSLPLKGFMEFNVTVNNISVISWRSIILVEAIGVPGENHRPAAGHQQTLSHNVVSGAHRHERYIQTHNVSGDRH